MPADEKYELEAMPVPVVMVALKGGAGGRVIERGDKSGAGGREIAACEGGVFFLPAYTPVVVCSGSGEGIELALAHTNLHWGSLAMPVSNPPAFKMDTSVSSVETSIPSPPTTESEASDGGVTAAAAGDGDGDGEAAVAEDIGDALAPVFA